jgi:uncharacterized protein YjaZ
MIMVDLNKMLNEVINDAIRIGFPIANSLERYVYIDKQRYDRVGACYRYMFPERYEIHLSEDVVRAKITDIKNIIAHEVLHSCFLSMDHGYVWSMYKDRMNTQCKYNIQIKYSWHEILK